MSAGNFPELVICLIITGSIGIIYILKVSLKSFSEYEYSGDHVLSSVQDSWVFRLFLNILGYATIFMPGYFIYKYVKSSRYLEKRGNGCFPSLIRVCIVGRWSEADPSNEPLSSPTSSVRVPVSRSALHEAGLVLLCFFGLQASYLTWGILQEKVMTQEYLSGLESPGQGAHFRDSQFLVFVNRVLAFLLSGAYILGRRWRRDGKEEPKGPPCPLYKYAYSSFSNLVSSWCQYEALKYVSFPSQVLAKACKIIPVMLVGKIMSHKRYELYEYITAILITMGMAFFMLGSAEDHPGGPVTTFSGLLLLACYLFFDSFTSNWQGALFSAHGMPPVQMMCAVNLFSCLFTAVSLIQQGGFAASLSFTAKYPKFLFDCLVLSVCSAAGQLFIYFTIAQFGAVVFVIIMTIRQGLAILLSCIIYHHHITSVGIIGIFLVFVSVFARIYCSHRLKAKKLRLQLSAASKV